MRDRTTEDSTTQAPDPFRRPFLATHLALAASQREYARLSAALVQHAKALRADGVEADPEVRQSPQRCIVQLGHVAATIAWLPSAESVAEGQLLVVVWRGTVARSGAQQFERPAARPVAAATSVWECSYSPCAESEATWSWQPQLDEAARCSSTELAARCAAELHRAYLAA